MICVQHDLRDSVDWVSGMQTWTIDWTLSMKTQSILLTLFLLCAAVPHNTTGPPEIGGQWQALFGDRMYQSLQIPSTFLGSPCRRRRTKEAFWTIPSSLHWLFHHSFVKNPKLPVWVYGVICDGHEEGFYLETFFFLSSFPLRDVVPPARS